MDILNALQSVSLTPQAASILHEEKREHMEPHTFLWK